MADFATCFAFVLGNEAGSPPNYLAVRDPRRNDPEAAAICGINSAAFPKQFVAIAWLTGKERATAVEAFYRATYFTSELAQLSNPIAMRVMDAEVNEGQEEGVRLLQKVCHALGATIEVDGALGPLTAAAANACDQDALVAAFKAARVAAYEAIGSPDLPEWIARAEK
jgi:lysozyme family protein